MSEGVAPQAIADVIRIARPIPAAPQDARYARHLLAWVAALTLFRLAALAVSRTDLFFDEAQYWFWSRELAFGYYSKPPLIGWIIRGATELCGMGEACIRAPAPLIHGATALVVGAIGRALYGARIGFWSGLVYATLPGVTLSSSLISTDAPLLFCVALALLATIKLTSRTAWGWGALLGVALGFGLLAKYAMLYFLLGLAAYAAASRQGRALLGDARLYLALAVAALVIAPNLWWNAQNGFATFAHTADNAKWAGPLVNPEAMLAFLGGQFGVFGPVLFAGFVLFLLRWRPSDPPRSGNGEAERLLLAFCLPVLLLMLGQALISRAHANWAAFAYVPATVLITAVLLREGWRRLFRLSLGLHLAVVPLLALGGAMAGRIALPGGADPFARVLGWRALAEAAGAKAEAEGFRAIATDRRALAAQLLYYLRDRDIPIVALREGDDRPRDHFELTRPLRPDTPRPVLLVSLRERRDSGLDAAGAAETAAGTERRRVYFYLLREKAP